MPDFWVGRDFPSVGGLRAKALSPCRVVSVGFRRAKGHFIGSKKTVNLYFVERL